MLSPVSVLPNVTLAADAVLAGYDARHPVLQNVAATIKQGEVTVLIGPNGSGKSTLLRVLGGALKPYSGKVLVGVESVYRIPARDLARRIAFVPQDNPAPFAFTVEELVELGAGANDSISQSVSTRVEAALRLFDLESFAGRSLTNLSGGERQRAALARAWAQNTPFLLLDEPTAHLDLRHQSLLVRAVKSAAQNDKRGVLLVLHDLNLARECADMVFLLHQGQIVAQGAAPDVLTPETLSPVYQTGLRTIVGEDRSVWLRPE